MAACHLGTTSGHISRLKFRTFIPLFFLPPLTSRSPYLRSSLLRRTPAAPLGVVQGSMDLSLNNREEHRVWCLEIIFQRHFHNSGRLTWKMFRRKISLVKFAKKKKLHKKKRGREKIAISPCSAGGIVEV